MSVRTIYLIILCVVIIFSCKNQEEIVTNNFTSNPLVFSTDTILFDTLITTGKVSITKRLKVLNSSSNAVIIKSLFLGSKSQSDYNLFLNGQENFSFNDVKILGNDSLYILVNINPKVNNSNSLFIKEDSIVFNISNFESKVTLLTWGQDAYYFYNDTIKSDFTFKNDKPNVIYGNLVVDTLIKLKAISNTKLFFYNGAKIINKGSFEFIGDKAIPIILQSLRLDDKFYNQPGLWSGLYLTGSGNSVFKWVNIKNAIVGIEVNNLLCDLNISHCKFFNLSNYGLNLIQANDVFIDNSLFYKSLKELLFSEELNSLKAYNNTFANISSGFSRQTTSVTISSKISDLNFVNNIVWGDLQNEFSNKSKSPTTLNVAYNLFKAKEIDLNYTNNYYLKSNNEFEFKDISKYDFRADSIYSNSSNKKIPSKAKNNGYLNLINNDFVDLNGNLRDTNPDIGAFEY